jgi:K+-sensing histidine kinase KdpD
VRLEGRTVAPVLARCNRDSLATEVILGHRRQSGWLPWDTTSDLVRMLAGVDVHVLRTTSQPR